MANFNNLLSCANTSLLAVNNNLSDLQSVSAARTNLGLGTAATQNTGTFLQVANNLSDLASASTARTNLGLGTAATQATGTFLQVANNLSDLASASTARTNLGLGTAATQSTGTFLQTANNLSDVASASTALTNLGVKVATLSNQSAATSATGSTTHGFGTTPTLVLSFLVCGTANVGYSPGDIVPLASNGRGSTAWANATSFGYANDNSAIIINPKGGGATQTITAADWTITVEAVAL